MINNGGGHWYQQILIAVDTKMPYTTKAIHFKFRPIQDFKPVLLQAGNENVGR